MYLGSSPAVPLWNGWADRQARAPSLLVLDKVWQLATDTGWRVYYVPEEILLLARTACSTVEMSHLREAALHKLEGASVFWKRRLILA